MTPIVHAIKEINEVIPEEILQEVFGSKSKGKRRDVTPVNVEYSIREQVITKRVISNLNIQSQRTIKVPYSKINFLSRTYDRAVIRVSKKHLAGCEIVTPLAVVYTDEYDNTGNIALNTDYSQTIYAGRMQRLSYGHDNIQNMQTADLSMVGPNTILVENFAYTERVGLLCTVSHDAELMTLPKGYWAKFAELCTYAVEAYVYRKLHIKVDRAKLSGGMELGSFKETIDEYRDSEKMYKEALEKFRKYDNLGNAKNRQRRALAQGAAFIQ